MLRRRLVCSCCVAVAACWVAGCTDPNSSFGQGSQAPRGPDTDIYKVICTFPQNMWRSFDSSSGNDPRGFEFVMLLLSRATGRGVYAPGTFHLTIYTVDRTEDSSERKVAIELSADMADIPKRRASSIGESYQPSIWWGDMDLCGQEIEIAVEYVSPSGRVVRSQTTTRFVPQRKK